MCGILSLSGCGSDGLWFFIFFSVFPPLSVSSLSLVETRFGDQPPWILFPLHNQQLPDHFPTKYKNTSTRIQRPHRQRCVVRIMPAAQHFCGIELKEKKKIFLFDSWIYSERKKCGYYCRVNDCVCLFGADKFRFSTKKSYSPFRWWIREREREEWERKKQGGWKWGIGYHVSGRTKKKWRKRWRERKKNSNFISFGNSKPSRFTIVVGMK